MIEYHSSFHPHSNPQLGNSLRSIKDSKQKVAEILRKRGGHWDNAVSGLMDKPRGFKKRGEEMDEIVISEHTVDIFDIVFTSLLNGYMRCP